MLLQLVTVLILSLLPFQLVTVLINSLLPLLKVDTRLAAAAATTSVRERCRDHCSHCACRVVNGPFHRCC